MGKRAKTRTTDQIVCDINTKLTKFKQTTQIILLIMGNVTNKLAELSSGIRLSGTDVRIFLSRMSTKLHDRWYENFDKVYGSPLYCSEAAVAIKAIGSSLGGVNCQQTHGTKIAKNLNTGVPHNKDKKGWTPPGGNWQTGKTKATDPRLQRLSDNRSGPGNSMYGTTMSEEAKTEKSEMMKQRIKDGIFTPKSNNRQTHLGANTTERNLDHRGKLHIIQ